MNSRTDLMLGEGTSKLFVSKKVAVFGLGGVGGYVLEALVRSNFINIDIFDFDKVDESNINRQIIATSKTVGKFKSAVALERAKEINPKAKVNSRNIYVDNYTIGSIDFSVYDYVVDCVDSVEAKMGIIKKCNECGTKLISCMGTGNKLDITKLYIADITKTDTCPLARVIRKKCRDAGIEHLTVLASKEEPIHTGDVVGSMIFVPAAAGLLIASYIVKDIIGENDA